MKKTISILILGAFPAFAVASGDDVGVHNMGEGHTKEHSQHGSSNMHNISKDNHDSDAGRPGIESNVSRTIEMTMNDNMRFTPDKLKFKLGETVRFIVRNDGKIKHEMVIGAVDELKSHAKSMRTNLAMQHTDPNMVSLASGQQGELVWQFDKSGNFNFACLLPGHLEAGMVGKIEIRQ